MAVTTTGAVIFLYMARQWKSLMMLWFENEGVFLKKPYLLKQRLSLRTKIHVSAWTMLTLGAIEHVLAKYSQINLMEREAQYCNYVITNRLKYYATRDFRHLFSIVPWHPILGILSYVSVN